MRDYLNKRKYTILMGVILLLAAILIVAFCLPFKGEGSEGSLPTLESVSLPESPSEPEEPPFEPITIRLRAAGDNLIHSSIYNQAKARAKDGGYDFGYAYENISGLIKDCDLAMINQETVVAPIYEPSDYPCFNSPVELQQEMLDLGFTVFNQANNHVLDKGEKGILSALEQWKTHPEALVTGVYENEADYENIRVKEVNGLTFAFIGMTEMTNGLSLPEGSEVVILHTAEEEKIKTRIEKAKTLADVVVVNTHWGQEYTHTPNDGQTSLAQKMADWGADLIVGYHPHVLQPIQWLDASDGRKVLCAYSLGNFISAQDKGARMIGGILDVTFTKETADAHPIITSAGLIPIVTQYDGGFRNIRLYPWSSYTPELAKSHGVRNNDSKFSYDFIKNTLDTVIGTEFLEE